MFLVNSRLDHFSAPHSREDPLSRSYGVNLPSSLAVIHSSTLEFSSHPPVSVYGTGRYTLITLRLFSRVWLPALSGCTNAPGTVGARLSPTSLQRAFPSARGSVTPRSSKGLCSGRRILDRLSISYPFRVRIRSRLTLSRLASLRNPWVYGVNISIFIVVTYAYIFFSGRSRMSHGTPSTHPQCSPTDR